MYRNPQGLKCPIGFMIPDDKYDPAMENKDPITLARDFSYFRIFSDAELSIMCQIQECHDNADENDFINSFNEKGPLEIIEYIEQENEYKKVNI